MGGGRVIVVLAARDPFAGYAPSRDIVPFVSVLSQSPRPAPSIPLDLPSAGEWLVRILARQNRFVIGLYRRHTKAIRHLGTLDRVFGVPVTTRNWNTIRAIARALESRTGVARRPSA
jgi:hypothetical protein